MGRAAAGVDRGIVPQGPGCPRDLFWKARARVRPTRQEASRGRDCRQLPWRCPHSGDREGRSGMKTAWIVSALTLGVACAFVPATPAKGAVAKTCPNVIQPVSDLPDGTMLARSGQARLGGGRKFCVGQIDSPFLLVFGIGGGGGGGGAGGSGGVGGFDNGAGGGGGAGAAAQAFLLPTTEGECYTVALGAGGKAAQIGGPAGQPGVKGSDGKPSSLQRLVGGNPVEVIVVLGGAGGSGGGGSQNPVPGAGGTGAQGGGSGGAGSPPGNNISGSAGGSSQFADTSTGGKTPAEGAINGGGGGGGGASFCKGGDGGNGGTFAGASAGKPGQWGSGGGGGGALGQSPQTGTDGGEGGPGGLVIFWGACVNDFAAGVNAATSPVIPMTTAAIDDLKALLTCH